MTTQNKASTLNEARNTQPNVSLAFFLDTSNGNKISLVKNAHVIGRASEDIVLQDPAISRHHCRTLIFGGSVYIEDLNSSNKTFLNSHALIPHSKQALRHGDIIKVGKKTLVFHQPKRTVSAVTTHNGKSRSTNLVSTTFQTTGSSKQLPTQTKTRSARKWFLAIVLFLTILLVGAFLKNTLLTNTFSIVGSSNTQQDLSAVPNAQDSNNNAKQTNEAESFFQESEEFSSTNELDSFPDENLEEPNIETESFPELDIFD